MSRGDIPTPRVIAASVALGIVDSRQVPLWAAYWLVDGYDGEALRVLAGFSGNDAGEVHDILPDALAECGVQIFDSVSAAAEVRFTDLARMYDEGRAGAVWVISKVEEILDIFDNEPDVVDLPLGALYGLSCEWETGWGRTEQQLVVEVEQACAAQLAG